MRNRKLLAIVLPLFLIALILTLGLLMPQRMMETMKLSYVGGTVSAELEDIEPYRRSDFATLRDRVASWERLVNYTEFYEVEEVAVEPAELERRLGADRRDWLDDLLSRWSREEAGFLTIAPVGSSVITVQGEPSGLWGLEYGGRPDLMLLLDEDTGFPLMLMLTIHDSSTLSPELCTQALLEVYAEYFALELEAVSMSALSSLDDSVALSPDPAVKNTELYLYADPAQGIALPITVTLGKSGAVSTLQCLPRVYPLTSPPFSL